MEQPATNLRRKLLKICILSQEALGNDHRAVVLTLNALLEATVEYSVRCTTKDNKIGQKRFNELTLNMYKVMQEFFTEHTGNALIIELPNKS